MASKSIYRQHKSYLLTHFPSLILRVITDLDFMTFGYLGFLILSPFNDILKNVPQTLQTGIQTTIE